MNDQPFNSKYALTDVQMKNFCEKHGINANILTLEEYNLDPSAANLKFIIYTGNDSNKYNTLSEREKEINSEKHTFEKQAITHHWLGGVGNLVFDSYGYYGDYLWPDNTTFVKTIPSRLQEFDSDVCGLYVLAFLSYCELETDYSNIGADFANHYGFSTNRNANDSIVIQWYESKKNN